MTYLDYLLWGSLIISIITSLVRAANIGFQRETYALTVLSLLPIIYDVSFTGSIQVIMFNVFHLLVAIFGTYRWWKVDRKQKHGVVDEESGYHDKRD
jgi:uncharacterized membrane protein